MIDPEDERNKIAAIFNNDTIPMFDLPKLRQFNPKDDLKDQKHVNSVIESLTSFLPLFWQIQILSFRISNRVKT